MEDQVDKKMTVSQDGNSGDDRIEGAVTTMSRIASSPMKTYKPRGTRRGKNEGVAAAMPRNEGSLMKTYKLRGKRGKNTKKLAEAATSEQQPTGSEPNEDEVIVHSDGTPPMVKQQHKRKRGADAEIAQSYLSSSAKKESPPSSRFRPRKPVPVFRRVDLGDRDDNRIVGKRVKVYWSGSKKWFIGRIESFHRRNKLHNVVYEDGDKEDLELRKERFELEILPHEDFEIVRCQPRRRVSEAKSIKGSDSEEGNVVSADDDGNGVSHESEGGIISKNDEDESEEAESGDSEEDEITK